jgi:hypothetical protein
MAVPLPPSMFIVEREASGTFHATPVESLIVKEGENKCVKLINHIQHVDDVYINKWNVHHCAALSQEIQQKFIKFL